MTGRIETGRIETGRSSTGRTNTDWVAHLGRTRRLTESVAWIGSALSVLLVGSAAWALWPAGAPGLGDDVSIIIDLPPMEAEAVADDPGPAPTASSFAPDAPDAPDLNDDAPEPEAVTETAPDFDQPEMPELQEVAEALPDTTPPAPLPEPEPEPVLEKAEVESPVQKPAPPKPAAPKKPAKVAEKPKEATGRKTEASAEQKAGSVSNAGSRGTADEQKRWQSRVQTTVAKHMRRKSFNKTGRVTLVIAMAPSGAVTAVSMQGSVGDPSVDAQILTHAQRMPDMPPPPDGAGRKLNTPVKIDR